MKPPKSELKKPGRNSEARKSLIRAHMRFILQREEMRFSKELLALLLEEGCNLPLELAKPIFYRAMITTLSAKLDPSLRGKLTAGMPPDRSEIRHPQFHALIQAFCSHVPNPEEPLAGASLDAIAVVCRRWMVDRALLSGSAARFDEYLREAVQEIAEQNPGGELASQQFDNIRRRVRMALITSLLRHARDPASFKAAFGSVPEALATMQKDPAVLPRAMDLLSGQVPYFPDIASRTFWRTLNAMDTDY